MTATNSTGHGHRDCGAAGRAAGRGQPRVDRGRAHGASWIRGGPVWPIPQRYQHTHYTRQILERGGRPCGCGQRGCWETYASATSVVARTREALAAAAAAAASEGEGDGQQASSSVLASIPPERLTAKDVFDAAYDDQRGDALAKTVVEEVRGEGVCGAPFGVGVGDRGWAGLCTLSSHMII